MDQQRIQQAMARITAAATRIEAAAQRPAPAAPPPAAPAPADGELARKHETLKREAWAALAEIDSLIEAIEA